MYEHLPLKEFIEELSKEFTRYQRTIDGKCQIVPRQKQKEFLEQIITGGETCFHFSEVGSGKTKVILPLLCQAFLSNNVEAHRHFARGGQNKQVLIILVPEHLVADACSQVYRYCLNLNFGADYKVHGDISALKHREVQLHRGIKRIFITSFNQLKKALTNEEISKKVRPYREQMLCVMDEVDDFLDRDKLVFNICSNQPNEFSADTIKYFFEVSKAVYHGKSCPNDSFAASANPDYWVELFAKFESIHHEVQQKSRSINKSFGIFNAHTLRHCSGDIANDIKGYKSLIARPYDSVNRAMPGSFYSDVERTMYLTYYILQQDIAKYDELFQQQRKFISFEYFNTHVLPEVTAPRSPRSSGSPRAPFASGQLVRKSSMCLEYDDLVYGTDALSSLVGKHGDQTKEGLTRFLYDSILRSMEVRKEARSVNSIDVVFNFDCIGFTGTPFIDNYPTFSYIRKEREDEIPDLIDRSFYVYSNDKLPEDQFESRFRAFQAKNSNVEVEYVPSDFMQEAATVSAAQAAVVAADASGDADALAVALKALEDAEAYEDGDTDAADVELAILSQIFEREAGPRQPEQLAGNFNVIVDLCGIFKKATVYEVRNLVLEHFGQKQFEYIYHIDQDGNDRVLDVASSNVVQYDEDFYSMMCSKHGVSLREKIFFFIDNRNVVGKDVPFQLPFQQSFEVPLFDRSVVLVHDVNNFSHMWQAMGRSRTMNETRFTLYKNGVKCDKGDIAKLEHTRELYVANCDSKVTGNLSSIYQTLISLFNLAKDTFSYTDEIVNVFLDKMENSITAKVQRLDQNLAGPVFGAPVPIGILTHLLTDKFSRSSSSTLHGLIQEVLATPKPVKKSMVDTKQLFDAAGKDEADLVRELLAGGTCWINRPNGDNERTPLHAAAREGHANIVQMLLHAGCEVDPKAGGWTPLMNIAYKASECSGENRANYERCIELLIQYGASTTVVEPKYRRTARDWAMKSRNTVFVDMFDVHKREEMNASAPSRGGTPAVLPGVLDTQPELVRTIFAQIVQNKFEQRAVSGDHHDEVKGGLAVMHNLSC